MTDKYIAALRQIQKLVNEALDEAPRAQPAGKSNAARVKPAPAGAQLSFDMHILAFIKKFAQGKSGPQKFTLLLAYLVKGDVKAQVTWRDIDGQWNKMKTLLGPSNPVHGNRAKANGWVDSVKAGSWKLTDSWKNVIAS